METKKDSIAELEKRIREHKERTKAAQPKDDTDSGSDSEADVFDINGNISCQRSGLKNHNKDAIESIEDRSSSAERSDDGLCEFGRKETKEWLSENDLARLMEAKKASIAELENRVREQKLRLLARAKIRAQLESSDSGSDSDTSGSLDDTQNDVDTDIQDVEIEAEMTAISTTESGVEGKEEQIKVRQVKARLRIVSEDESTATASGKIVGLP